MTIKELCIKYRKCADCPFSNACDLLECLVAEYIPDRAASLITKSIIETAKRLTESEVDNNG